MATFLLILGGLIAFNFILLKFSMQSVDADKKKVKAKKANLHEAEVAKTKSSNIPEAA